MPVKTPLITDDAVVFGLLSLILFVVFYTASSNKTYFKKFYSVVPALLLCYFIPGLMNTFGIIDGETSGLYKVSSRYLLPASLVGATSYPASCNCGQPTPCFICSFASQNAG